MSNEILWDIDDEPVLPRVLEFDADYEHYTLVVCDEDGHEMEGVRVPDDDLDRLHEEIMRIYRLEPLETER
jgi:hypothetical protein